MELAGLRLDQALARMFPQHSRSRLQRWLKDGHLRVDGSAPEARRAVRGGELVALDPPAESDRRNPEAQPIPLSVVHEDAEILVIDKPAGLIVHPGAGNPDHTLLNALLAHAPDLARLPRGGIVHRLDKDTSGLLVVAKTETAHTSLVRQLAERTLGRTYLALVHGIVAASGAIDKPIGRDSRHRTRMAVSARGKPARTSFRAVERLGVATLLECRLDTGRTHQIRVHLQSIGHPLVGDPVYRRGARPLEAAAAFARQALHATGLALTHPASGEELTFRSAPPADLQRLLRALRAMRGKAGTKGASPGLGVSGAAR